MTEPSPRNPRRLREGAVIAVSFFVFLALLLAFRGVLVPFLLAIFVAYIIDPLVGRVARVPIPRRGPMGRALALITVYLSAIGLTILAAILAVPMVADQINSLQESAPRTFATIRNDYVPRLDKWLNEIGESFSMDEDEEPEETADAGEGDAGDPGVDLSGDPADPPADPDAAADEEPDDPDAPIFVTSEQSAEPVPARSSGSNAPATMRDALDAYVADLEGGVGNAFDFLRKVLTGLITFVYQAILVLMLTAFIVIDRERIVAFFHQLVPTDYRARYVRAVKIVDAGLSGVVRGQVTICVINGLLTWIGLLLLGVKYSLFLGLVATVFSLIPIFGTILSSVPIVAVAMVEGNMTTAVLVLGWISLIHLLEANIINPRVMGQAAKLHPVIIVFALLAGEHAFGVIGALLAVPAASILVSMFRYARIMATEREAEPEPSPG